LFVSRELEQQASEVVLDFGWQGANRINGLFETLCHKPTTA
jgi:hypothetical protein